MIDERRWVDDVYYYIRWRLKLEGYQEVRGVTVSRAAERVPPSSVNELP